MKNLLLTILLVLPNIGIGQDYGNNADAMKLCSVLQKNSFGTDVDAENALDKILNVIGASKRFVLQPCANINNAVATSFKGIRYILYDKNFMNSINYGNNWGNLFVLAHEVGHHINGHSVDLVLYAAEAVEPKSLAIKRQQELEADEFAGFILSKLGGPISAANQSISKLSTNSDDTYCFQDPSLIPPIDIQTVAAFNISSEQAQSGGTITSFTKMKSRGVVWSTSPNPTIENDFFSENGSLNGSYDSYMYNLQPDTKYYFRAYGEDCNGVFYGNELQFTTLP